MSAAPLTEQLFHRIFPGLTEAPITDEDMPGVVACSWWVARHDRRMKFIVPEASRRMKRGGLRSSVGKWVRESQVPLTEDLALRIEPVGSYEDDVKKGRLQPGEEWDFGQRVYDGPGFRLSIQGLFGPLLDGLKLFGSGPEKVIVGLGSDDVFVAAVMPLRGHCIRQPGEPMAPPLANAGSPS